jgi:hypothetical protein
MNAHLANLLSAEDMQQGIYQFDFVRPQISPVSAHWYHASAQEV